MAVKTKERISPGPAPGLVGSPAAAVPIVANIPAPMMAPIPSAVTSSGPSAFFNRRSGSSASAVSLSSAFLRKSFFNIEKSMSAAEPAFQREVLRLQIGKCPAHFRKFRFGTVDFQSNDIGNLLHFTQKRSDIFQVRQRSVAVLISFAAKRDVSIETKTVVKASS